MVLFVFWVDGLRSESETESGNNVRLSITPNTPPSQNYACLVQSDRRGRDSSGEFRNTRPPSPPYRHLTHQITHVPARPVSPLVRSSFNTIAHHWLVGQDVQRKGDLRDRQLSCVSSSRIELVPPLLAHEQWWAKRDPIAIRKCDSRGVSRSHRLRSCLHTIEDEFANSITRYTLQRKSKRKLAVPAKIRHRLTASPGARPLITMIREGWRKFGGTESKTTKTPMGRPGMTTHAQSALPEYGSESQDLNLHSTPNLALDRRPLETVWQSLTNQNATSG